MERLIFFTLDSAENRETLKLYTGNEERFLNINPFEARLKELDELKQLPTNWDGYGAIPIFSEVYDVTKNLITVLNDYQIDLISDIYPNPHGTISIEWANENNEKLVLEIGKTTYSFFIDYLDKKPEFKNGQNILQDTEILTSSVENLYRQNIPKFIL